MSTLTQNDEILAAIHSHDKIVQDYAEIRKNYNTLIQTHRDIFTKQIMISLWDACLKNIEEIPGMLNIKLAQIRAFVLNPDQKELILHKRTKKSRSEYHMIANLLHLTHSSVDVSIDKETKIPDNTDPNKWEDVGKKIRASHYSKFGSSAFKDIGKPRHYEKFNNNKELDDLEIDKDVKTIIISKPENWCWEFTS
jgi:hypothetical protein